MKHAGFLVCLGLTLLCAVSCKTTFDALLASNDNETKYIKAFEYYENGKYNKAVKLFESLATMSSGTERDDTVQFYWGLCNYRYRDFVNALPNFETFLEKFPRSVFTEDAAFFRTDCLYNMTYRYELDQAPTYKALTAINEFLIQYPSSSRRERCMEMSDDLNERLDRKAYENAKLYYKMEYYKSAVVAFKNILKDDSDNRYREEILYYTAMSSYKYANMSVSAKQKERFMSFVDDYFNFIEEYPDSQHARELTTLYYKVRNNETYSIEGSVQ